MEKLNIKKDMDRYTRIIEEENKRRGEQLSNLEKTSRTIKTHKFMHELDKDDLKENGTKGAGACGCLLI